jgi:hypothetical protein
VNDLAGSSFFHWNMLVGVRDHAPRSRNVRNARRLEQ